MGRRGETFWEGLAVRTGLGRRGMFAIVAASIVFGMLGGRAAGDRLTLRDGKTLEGDVIAEDDKTVTVELFIPPGYTIARRMNRAQVQTWERPSRDGAPYVLIPIFGEIGNDVTAGALRAGLEKARAAGPRYIVLAINSPGGNIGQMVEMIDLLTNASKDFQIVAYVKEAYSAAAVIAMSCPQVVMRPRASIGATVPFRMTENGPEDVAAKFRSVIEARMRAAVARGGHADLLIRGMSEMDLELFLDEEHGKPVLRTSAPGTVIKSKGQILTLTADEAVKCGLADGTAADMAELGKRVVGSPWHESTRRPWNMVVATDGMRKERLRELAERQVRFIARQDAIQRVRPEWDAIERRISFLNARIAAAQDAISKLAAKRDSELKQMKAEYQKELPRIALQSDSVGAAAHAQEEYNSRVASVGAKFGETAASLQATGEADTREVKQLRERQRDLVGSLPEE